MKFAIILSILLNCMLSYAQNYDYQWIGGYSNAEDLLLGINLIDFNGGQVNVSYFGESLNYELGFNSSFINNASLGTIGLHSNGCFIKDSAWNSVSGEEYLTGDSQSIYCDVGYIPENQGVLMLPDLINDSITYLFTKDSEINATGTDYYSPNFYGSIIKRNKQDSFEYNGMTKLNTVDYHAEDIIATPTADKKSWWLIQEHNQTNEIVKYLVGNDTIIEHDVQSIGVVFKAIEQGIGQNTFSPDGSMFAVNSEIGIHLYEFDNETGQLSNYQHIEYPDQINVAQGLAFSPNNRFIYVTTAENVYQVDIQDLEDIYHVGYYRSFDDGGWPVGLGMIHPGPDCRLYVSPGSSTYWLHVIHQPNLKGEDCQFQERAIELPARLSFNFPNLPNYRYLTGCDSTIVFPFSTTNIKVEETEDVLVYPNPLFHELHIDRKIHCIKYEIYNIQGQLVKSGIPESNIVELYDLIRGLYIIVLENEVHQKIPTKFNKM